MSDFLISMGLDDRALLDGLRRSEKQAAASGTRLGDGLAEGIEKAAKNIPTTLEKATRAAGAAGTAAGRQFGAGFTGQTTAALGGLPGQVGKIGQASGRTLAGSIGAGVGGLGRLLQKQVESAFTGGPQLGQALGKGVAEGMKAAGATSGATFNKIVQEARAAAKAVDLIFDATTLEFQLPSGGAVPQDALNRLSKFSPALQQARTALDAYRASTAGAGAATQTLAGRMEGLADTGDVISGIVEGIAFSLTNSLTNGAGTAASALGALVTAFAQLDLEIRKAAAATGDGANYAALANTIDQVGIEAAGTTMEVAQLTTSLARAGFSAAQIQDVMPGVVRAAEATGTSFEQMGDVVGNTLRAFALDVSETARVTDVLVNTANSSNNSIDDLAYSMSYAAPVAQALGVDIEQLSAVIGLMANAGIKGSVAGTGLRMGLTRLQKAASGASGESLGLSKGQEKLAASMKVLGASVTDANGEIQLTADTIINLKRSFESFGKAKTIEISSALFGDEAGPKFLGVVNQSEESIRSMFSTIANSDGAVDKSRDAMQGFDLTMKQLEGTADSLKNTIGGVLAGALLPFVNIGNALLGVVAGMPGPLKQLAAAVLLVAAAYGAARVASALFTAALKTQIIVSTLAEIKSLGAGLRAAFIADAVIARQSWAKFVAFLNATSFTGLITQLRAFTAANKAAIVTYGAAGLAIAGIAAPIITYFRVTERARQVTAETSKALDELKKSTESTGKEFGDAPKRGSQFTQALDELYETAKLLIPQVKILDYLLRGWGEDMDNASRNEAISAIQRQVEELDATMVGAVNNAAALTTKLQGLPKGQTVSQPDERLGRRTLQDLTNSQRAAEQMARTLDDLYRKNREEDPALAAQFRESARSATATARLAEAQKDALAREMEARKANTKEITKQAMSLADLTTMMEANDELDAAAALKAEADLHTQVADGQLTSAEAAKKLGAVKAAQLQASIGLLEEELALIPKAKLNEIERAEAGVLLDTKRAELAKLRAEQTAQEIADAREQNRQLRETTALQNELNNLVAQAPERQAAQQLRAGEALLGFAGALANLEQSRFTLAKSRIDFELEAARKRGASEQELEAIRRQGDVVEQQALQARGQALVRAQVIEAQILAIKQRAAELEARRQINEASQRTADAELGLSDALLGGNAAEITNAQLRLQLAREGQQIAVENLRNLVQLAPLERASLLVQQEANRNLLQAEAAGKGLRLELGSIGDALNPLEQAADAAQASLGDAEGTAGGLTDAAGSADDLANSGIDSVTGRAASQAVNLARSMGQATSSAQQFLSFLSSAAGLPSARFTGGPVEGGGTYRINDGPGGRSLGMESFLSSTGRLSLLNKPANSTWTAPSRGVVLPAALTSQLQDAGAFSSPAARQAVAFPPRGGSGAATTEALNRLTARLDMHARELRRLSDKDWTVRVQTRRSDGGLSLANRVNSML